MAIFDLFSKRQADADNAGRADVYQYSQIPQNLRVQVQQISLEAIGHVGSEGTYYLGEVNNPWWVQVERIFLREKGLSRIGRDDLAGSRVLAFMDQCSTPDWLDLLELITIAISANPNDYQSRENWRVSVSSADAISEINYRLRQAGVGYQIEGTHLIRVDSQYIHAEIVKPALSLLAQEGFSGPRDEFLAAHDHYRTGDYRQAVAMAANSLESTFKAIFDKKGWNYEKGARISDLVKVARSNHLWPDYMDGSFDQLLGTLKSGLPKIRDNDASHGQGASVKVVPSYIAGYALHLCAAKIVFIAEAAKG